MSYEQELEAAVEQVKVTALREVAAVDLEEIGWTDAARAAAAAARRVGGGARRAFGAVKKAVKSAFGGPQRAGKAGGTLGIAATSVRTRAKRHNLQNMGPRAKTIQRAMKTRQPGATLGIGRVGKSVRGSDAPLAVKVRRSAMASMNPRDYTRTPTGGVKVKRAKTSSKSMSGFRGLGLALAGMEPGVRKKMERKLRKKGY